MSVGLDVLVEVGVIVGLAVPVGLGVLVGVRVGVSVGVAVSSGVGVTVGIGVGVGVGTAATVAATLAVTVCSMSGVGGSLMAVGSTALSHASTVDDAETATAIRIRTGNWTRENIEGMLSDATQLAYLHPDETTYSV